MTSRTDDPNERLLIEAAQKDPGRFAELYELHFERVYAYIARRVPDRASAQDLTSHVFHQALANLGKFKWRGAPFAAWLFRIAANSVIDHSKRATRELPDPVNSRPPRFAAGDVIHLEEFDRRARLFKLVNQLPEDQRRVIYSRFAEEKSIKEIANQLGRTEGAVKQLQFRALENLRARMLE
ncbi:MAG: sigma-70 family RNA polymerase sigma factor [Pyrinomonadaceae bacterium]